MFLSQPAFALQSDNFTYEVTASDNITITGYTGTLGTVVIPDTIDLKPVVCIGNEAFDNKTNLTSITIPSSVTSIGTSAFRACKGLTSVILMYGVKTIGGGAFYNCGALTSITIPSSVTSIGSGAFEFCNGLTSITIPSSVTSIESVTFMGCSGLTNVQIPSSVTYIGFEAFCLCSRLTSITIPSSVTSIGSGAFAVCTNLFGALFYGNAPEMEDDSVFDYCARGFTVYYLAGAKGFTNPWYGYPTALYAPPTTTTTAGGGGGGGGGTPATTTVLLTTTTITVLSFTTTSIQSGPCPAQKVLGVNNQKLTNLRTFRDSRLANSTVGLRIIQTYYNNADSINAALDNSPALQAAARKVLEAAAEFMEQ